MEMDKTVKLTLAQGAITKGSLVVRAWKTDPAYQYEIGIVTEVTQSRSQRQKRNEV